MVYTPRTWVDRQVERPKTYNLQENGDGSVTLLPAEGIIIEAGTPLIAENMNQIEQGLEDVSEAVGDGVNDYIRQPAFAGTAGTSTSYTVTLNPAPSVLLDGFGITIVPHVTNGTNATLNINGLGGYPLKKQNGLNYPAGRLMAGKPYTFRKVGPDFLADSAGGNGDAVVTDVRAGKKFTNDITDELVGELPVRDSGVTTVTPGPSAQTLLPGIRDYNLIVSGVSVPAANVLSGTTIAGTAGSMPNRGAIVITPGTTNQAISNGYHNGSGYVQGDPDLVPSKILSGVNIFGVNGSVIPYFGGAFAVNFSGPGAGQNAGGYYECFRVPAGFTGAALAGSINMGMTTTNIYQKCSFVIQDAYGQELTLLMMEANSPGQQNAQQFGMFIDRPNRQITTVYGGSGFPDSHGGWSTFNTDIGVNGSFTKPLDMNTQLIAYFKVEASMGGGYTTLAIYGKLAYN